MSRAIIKRSLPYNVAAALTPYKKLRMAYGIGQYAYRNRAAIAKTARRFGRQWKKRGYKRRFQPKLAKRMVKTATSQKSKAVQDTDVGFRIPLQMGNIGVDAIKYPSIAANTANVNGRNSNVCIFKGTRICRQFAYTGSDIGPIVMHWALIQAKSEDFSPLGLGDGFFRSFVSTTSKERNFTGYNASSTWDMGKNCLALNPDQGFRILTRKKKIMHWKGEASADVDNKTFWQIDRYYKANKRMNFQVTGTDEPQHKIYEIFWYNTLNDDRFPADPVAENYISTYHMNTTYFRSLNN